MTIPRGITLAALLLVAACSDSTGPNPAQAAAINETVQSVDHFGEAPVWSEREESREDTTYTSVDTADNLITSTEWLEEVVNYSASENPDEYMMFDPQASVLWPGNLIQGKSIASGVPDAVPIADRASGNITLAIVSGDSSGTANSFFRHVDHFRFSDVNQAMNEILSSYQGGTPAKYSYSQEQVYSATQLNFDLGFGYSGPATTVEGEFNLSKSDEKSRIAVRLTQQFFTMVFDDPEGPAGVFGPSVTAATLAPYTGDGNPLCYISSVTYGRIYILVYESSASAQDLSAALNFAYNGGVASGNIDTEAEFNTVMSQTTVKALQIGGDPEAGLSAATALSFDAINEFMTQGANFSPKNVGAPISYTIKYLGDATLVRMNNVMEYSVTQRTPLSSSESYTQSRFNMFMDNVLIVSSTDPFGGDGGVRIRVGTVDNVTGQETRLWQSQVTNGDQENGFLDFGQDAMDPGLVFPINATVPQIVVDDNTKTKVWLEFSVNEYDADRQWAHGRRYFEYDPATRTWKKANPSDLATEFYLTVDDTQVKLTFSVKRNDVQIN